MKKEARISVWVEVEVDESKFTEEFMQEFRESFFPFYNVQDHIEHLAWLFGTNRINELTNFIEGYGDPKDFGIQFTLIDDDDVELMPYDG